MAKLLKYGQKNGQIPNRPKIKLVQIVYCILQLNKDFSIFFKHVFQ